MNVRSITRGLVAPLVCIGIAACRGKSSTPASNGSDTTYHGVGVADPYRWLEDGRSPAVARWTDAQNARTDSVVAAFPQGTAIAKRVAALAETSPLRASPTIVAGTLYFLREQPPQPQPVLVASEWPNGKERVVVDVNALPGSLNITAYWPSPHGRYVAYGAANGGSELTTIHFVDVRTGRPLTDTLPFAGGGTSPPELVWDADDDGVTYARFPIPAAGHTVSWFDLSLYHHTLGTTSDRPAFGQGYSHIAEYITAASEHGREAAVWVQNGDSGPTEVYVRGLDAWHRVVSDTAQATSIAYEGDRLLVVSRRGTPRGAVFAIDDHGAATMVLAQRTWNIHAIAPIAGGLLVVEDSGPRWRVEHVRDDGSLVRVVGVPHENVSIEDVASSAGSTAAIITSSGWSTPPRWQRYDGATGALTTIYQVTTPGDFSRIQAQVIDAISKDGTHVPVSILSLPGVPRDGSAPTILYGYGGFDIPVAPDFGAARLAWLERGGMLAFANIRGGDEFGEDWHRQGSGLHKQNTFDDFYAAAQALVREKVTSPERLGIRGGSNGGLLMGAEVTQHPEAFRAVVSSVGIYDMLRHPTFPNGAFNVTEYGNPKDSAQFAALYAYSPMHHVRAGTAYPSVLMTTALNDARVAPWQSRKFAAALEAATTSNRPVLLLTHTTGGHGIDAPFAQRVGDAALMYTFFAHELGLPVDSASDVRTRVNLKR